MKASHALSTALLLGTTLIACGAAPQASSAPMPPTTVPAAATTASIPALVCAASRDGIARDRVARIEIRGADVPPELCSFLKEGLDEPFDEARIDASLRALWADGRVDDVTVALEEGEHSVLVYQVRMRPRVVAFEIRFGGALAALPDGMKLEQPAALNHALLRDLEARAVRELRASGFRRAKIDHEITPREGGVALVLSIELGPLALVKAVHLEGPEPKRARELAAVLLTAVGEPLNPDKLERDVLVMQADAYDHGMVDVHVEEPEVLESASGNAVEVVLRVNEGKVYRIGKVAFKGELIGPAATYKRDLWSTPSGGVFSRKVVAADIERIKRFHDAHGKVVEVTPAVEVNAAKSTVDITLQIEPQR